MRVKPNETSYDYVHFCNHLYGQLIQLTSQSGVRWLVSDWVVQPTTNFLILTPNLFVWYIQAFSNHTSGNDALTVSGLNLFRCTDVVVHRTVKPWHRAAPLVGVLVFETSSDGRWNAINCSAELCDRNNISVLNATSCHTFYIITSTTVQTLASLTTVLNSSTPF